MALLALGLHVVGYTMAITGATGAIIMRHIKAKHIKALEKEEDKY